MFQICNFLVTFTVLGYALATIDLKPSVQAAFEAHRRMVVPRAVLMTFGTHLSEITNPLGQIHPDHKIQFIGKQVDAYLDDKNAKPLADTFSNLGDKGQLVGQKFELEGVILKIPEACGKSELFDVAKRVNYVCAIDLRPSVEAAFIAHKTVNPRDVLVTFASDLFTRTKSPDTHPDPNQKTTEDIPSGLIGIQVDAFLEYDNVDYNAGVLAQTISKFGNKGQLVGQKDELKNRILGILKACGKSELNTVELRVAFVMAHNN